MASAGLLQQLQNEILEAVVRDAPLKTIADIVCARAENLAPGVLCSILTVDAEGRVHPLAAPSLPDSYSNALDGLPIGPSAGSCGTAAYRGEPVEVTDIETDPLWADYRALALAHGLRACWSSPIRARDGRVVGTFAFYYLERRGPAEVERRIVETCVHLCAIAIEHDEAQTRIHQLAYFDTLTGLPNRVQLQDRAAAMLANMSRESTFSILHVDLDEFRCINDTLGHRAGDLLLEGVAKRLVAIVGDRAFLARLGSDEFAIATISAEGRAAAGALAERIVEAIAEPFELDDQRVKVTASVGIAGAEPDALDLSELLRRAGMGLYAAQRDGGNAHRFFAAEMDVVMQLGRKLRQDIREALDAGEFALVYQPLVALETGELVGVEALLRWQHPVRGTVPPSDFIPIAEEMGVIGTLGDWALREACAAAAEWPREVRVAVNLSPLQLKQPGLVLDVAAALAKNGLVPSRLELEITESALIAENATTKLALRELHAIGVGLSMDDFGTGYSSLRALRSFPVGKIKIDQSFVREIGRNADSAAIVRAVIGLAHDLGLRTAAEGIENEAQLEWLALQGCTEGQGNYFSEPLSRAEMRRLLGSGDTVPLAGPIRGSRSAR